MVSCPLTQSSSGETDHVPETCLRVLRPQTIVWLRSKTLRELFKGWPNASSSWTCQPEFAISKFEHGDIDCEPLETHLATHAGTNSRHLFSCYRRSDIVVCFAQSADRMTETVTILIHQPQQRPLNNFTYMPHPPGLETIDLSTCISYSPEQAASVSFIEMPTEPTENFCNAQSEIQPNKSDGLVQAKKKKSAILASVIHIHGPRRNKTTEEQDPEEQRTSETETPEEEGQKPVSRAKHTETHCDAQSESQSNKSDRLLQARKKTSALPIHLHFPRRKKTTEEKDPEEHRTLEKTERPEDEVQNPIPRAWASLCRQYSNTAQTLQDSKTTPSPQILQESDWSARLSETIGDLLSLSRDTSKFDWSNQGLELDHGQQSDLEDLQSHIGDLSINIIVLDHFAEKDA